MTVNPLLSPAFARTEVVASPRTRTSSLIRSIELTQCLRLLQEEPPHRQPVQYLSDSSSADATLTLVSWWWSSLWSAEVEGLWLRHRGLPVSFPLVQLVQAFFQFVWFHFGVCQPEACRDKFGLFFFLIITCFHQGLVFLGFVSCCYINIQYQNAAVIYTHHWCIVLLVTSHSAGRMF